MKKDVLRIDETMLKIRRGKAKKKGSFRHQKGDNCVARALYLGTGQSHWPS